MMDKDRIKGAAQKLKGSIEKTVGRLVGSRKLETEGKIDNAAGSVRTAVGEVKDAARDATKDRSK